MHGRIMAGGLRGVPELVALVWEPLRAARVVESSQAIGYFFDVAPPEGTFSERELPRARPPVVEPLFFEGTANRIFADQRSQGIEGVGLLAQERHVRDNPGFKLPPGTDTYVLVGAFLGYEDPEEVVGPAALWGVPLTAAGRVHPATARKRVGVAGLIAVDLNMPEPEESGQNALRGLDPLMQCAMWCVFCLAVGELGLSRTTNHVRRFGRPGGRSMRLYVSPLLEILDRAHARKLGIGHALTASRHRFE